MRWTPVPFAVLLAACSSSSEPPPAPCEGVAPEGQEACLTGHYFDPSSKTALAPCPGFSPSAEKIGGRREVAFFAGPTVTEGDIVAEGRSLQHFYQTYDLTFFTRTPAQAAGLTHAISGTNAEIQDAARRAGIAPGTEPTAEQEAEVNRLVAEILFRDLRGFVIRQSDPPQDRVNVVVLGQIASPDVAAQLEGSVIGGLGLSPRLFAEIAADDASKNLFETLALPEQFTPTLFVGHSDIVRLAKNPDGIVAHEMGHALGLQHTQEPGNVMTQRQSSQACTAGLTDEQVAQLRGAAEAVAEAVADPAESFRVLVDLHRRIVDGVLLRSRAPR